MKRFILLRLAIVTASLLLLLGAIGVSAEDGLLIAPNPMAGQPVFVTVEGPDELNTIVSGNFPVNGSVTAADVVGSLLSYYHPDREITVDEYGNVVSVDGVENGLFGGDDGWHWAVKYHTFLPDGSLMQYIDIPTVSMFEYPILTSCSVLLYYGDPADGFALVTSTEEGRIQLQRKLPVYAENGELIAFDTEPLAGGTFSFRRIDEDEQGNTVFGPTFAFVADENGVLELDAAMTKLPNGTYFGSAGIQTDDTAKIGAAEFTRPGVVRASDLYIIENEEPVIEEPVIEEPKVDDRLLCCLLLMM